MPGNGGPAGPAGFFGAGGDRFAADGDGTYRSTVLESAFIDDDGPNALETWPEPLLCHLRMMPRVVSNSIVPNLEWWMS